MNIKIWNGEKYVTTEAIKIDLCVAGDFYFVWDNEFWGLFAIVEAQTGATLINNFTNWNIYENTKIANKKIILLAIELANEKIMTFCKDKTMQDIINNRKKIVPYYPIKLL